MRLVLALVTLATVTGAIAAAAPAITAPGAGLTVLLKFDGPHSDRSVAEMKREAERIMKQSGLQLNWKLRKEVTDESFPDLVVVRFKGKCMMEPTPFLYDERGPLAWTHTTDGAVLPFSEVACDKVRGSIRPALWARDYARGDLLMGRALGRVLAHEIYHVLGKTGRHGTTGVTQRSISGALLITDELGLQPDAIETLQQNQRPH